MKYVRRLYTLPESVAERVDQEHNSSGTVVDALKLYFEFKDTSKQLVAQNKQIITLLEGKTAEPVHTSIYSPELLEKLTEYRLNYPNGIFFVKDTDDDQEIWVRHKVTGKEVPASELEAGM